MTKTVKQIVDEYKNRIAENNKYFIMFQTRRSFDGYGIITNLYRDGVKVEYPSLDTEFHKYEFDSGYVPSMLDKNHIEWTHYELCGKIKEFSQAIEE